MPTPPAPSALDRFFQLVLKNSGVVVPPRSTLNIIGGVFADDPANDQTNLTLGGTASDAPGLFGDGSDGDAVCDGTTAVAGMGLHLGAYTILRDVAFHNLTINTGIVVTNGGTNLGSYGFNGSWRIFVSGTLTVNGHLMTDGQNGVSDGSGGHAGGVSWGNAVGTLGYGGDGTAIGTDWSYGGAGGVCSLGGPYTAPGGPVTPPPPSYGLMTLFTGGFGWLYGGRTNQTHTINGGGGGRDVGGGTGGGGGGVLDILARNLSGSGLISANGGNGCGPMAAAFHFLGSGGGGGGVIIVVARSLAGWTGSMQVNPGLGGPGGIGVDDYPGGPGQPGRVFLMSA